MKNTFLLKSLISLSIATSVAIGANNSDYKPVCDSDPFPKFEDIKAPILMPQNAKVEFSKDGHFLVNGKPRYLEGTVCYAGHTLQLKKPTYGYPECLNWLYETTQDYRDMQRIGFDTIGTALPNDWMYKYRKQYKFIYLGADEELFMRYADSGLPLYIDYTAAGWTHGGMRYVEGQEPKKEAFTVPGRAFHWMPYSATTPEGRQLWKEMWVSCAEYLKKRNLKPIIYELFNEPDYDDLSDFNKKLFAKKMRTKYNGNIDKLNEAWGANYTNFSEIAAFKKYEENVGLFVEWIKFMENCFVDICKMGAKEIRAVDGRKDVGICFQPIQMDGTNTNIFKTNNHLNAVCSSTGGGNFFQARFLKALSDGKPIFDGETYMGHTRESFRNKIILQYMRGFNASYIFMWSRRPNDPIWNQKNGGEKLAHKFPYMMLNPYSVKPEGLLGLMDAKKAIFDVDELFTPRNRGIKSDIAVIYSYPTNRLQRFPKSPITEIDTEKKYAKALEYGHIQYDILFEEQLKEKRQSRYKAIIAAGAASQKRTPTRLMQYAEDGGNLIVVLDALSRNEYGFARDSELFKGVKFGKEYTGGGEDITIGSSKMNGFLFRDVELSPDWKVLLKIAGKPAVFEKPHGKGKITFVNTKVSANDLRTFLAELTAPMGVKKLCEITNAITGAPCDAIEVAKASVDNMVGYILYNTSTDAQPVAIKAPENVDSYYDVLSKKIYTKSSDGKIYAMVKSDNPIILVGADSAKLASRYGNNIETVSAEKSFAIIKDLTTKMRNEAMLKMKAFDVPAEFLRNVNLRDYANLNNNPKLPTSTGEKQLLFLPWKVEVCNGIPFDFIRPDHNKNKIAIALGKLGDSDSAESVKGIKVDANASALYFLHACARSEGGEVMKYVVNYSDSTSVDIPIRYACETGDWTAVLRPDKNAMTVTGFVNPENLGYYIYKWSNPYPHKPIKTIDAILTDKNALSITSAITLETPYGDNDYTITNLVDSAKLQSLRGVGTASNPSFNDSVVEVNLTGARNTAGVRVNLAKPYALSQKAKDASFAFDVELSPEAQNPVFIVSLLGDDAKNAINSDYRLFVNGEGKFKVMLPLSYLVGDLHSNITGFEIKLKNTSSVKSQKMRISNVGVFEYRTENPYRYDAIAISSWGDAVAYKSDNYVVFGINERTTNWSGIRFRASREIELPEDYESKNLIFYINADKDALGNRNIGGQTYQLTVSFRMENGKHLHGRKITRPYEFTAGGQIDTIPASWQKVSIPMKWITPDGNSIRKNGKPKKIIEFSIQYKILPAERAGVQIKNISIE